ncbi:DUF4384 domain-containing protein [Telluribacter sp. SYSU D00476]|uniref:DUF4384 domain-containing protein n=1 Tax=Telluribacter sp. SYSU D00476 TaxID=2811430 RepID=UPI001FF17A1E|nr:DUF4384 domain-containing protein [Telluribacter sp. SYSU D00476]
MKLASYILIILLLVGLSTTWAQSYTHAEKIKIAKTARQLINDKYLANVEILTNYEANQPFEALQGQLNGLVKDAFFNQDVLIFNEFRTAVKAYTSVEEYIKDCRIFSGGKPLKNSLNFDEARFDIQKTKDGEPFVNVYLVKQLNGIDLHGAKLHYQNLTEFRVHFIYSKAAETFLNFKITGISKVDKWPPSAFTLSEQDAKAADEGIVEKPKDLLSALTSLTASIKQFVPVNTLSLTLEAFSYNNCGINDGLSDRIYATFSSCLQKQIKIEAVSAAQLTESPLRIRGYYQEDINNLKIVAELVDTKTNKVLSKAENSELPLTWLDQQGLRLKPATYQQEVAIQDTIRQYTPVAKTSLIIKVNTDRGRTGVEYWEGQQMRIEVIANRPCYLRLLYRLADGTHTLLENSFEIKPGQENKPVRIAPQATFICSAPFGTEYLLAYASEVPFCPIPTSSKQKVHLREEDGYKFVVGPLAAIIETLKCNQKQQETIAVDKVQITTRAIAKR